MTRDQIARLMQDSARADWGTRAHFRRFAALVAAAEREECAKICEGGVPSHYGLEWREATGAECAEEIRARGET